MDLFIENDEEKNRFYFGRIIGNENKNGGN